MADLDGHNERSRSNLAAFIGNLTTRTSEVMEMDVREDSDLSVREDRNLSVEFSCVMCKKQGFSLDICKSCEQVRVCDNPVCHKTHDCICPGQDLNIISVCEIDKGRVLEIEEAELDAGGRVLDLGSSNSCVRHGHNQHGDYIDFAQLTVDHLPQEIRHPDMFDFIVAEARKTVRISSKWTSMNRPDNDPYAHQRGTRRSRLATGFCNTFASPDSFCLKACEVPDCHRTADLGPEHYIFAGEVYIYTNKHVVFDEEEMRRTSVEFFYDAYNKSGVVKEYGLKFNYTKNVSDRTFFTITIHDESFLKFLIDLTNDYIIATQKLSEELLEKLEPFIIIASHPHGMPKKISIGKTVKVTEENVSPETERNAKQFGQIYKEWGLAMHDMYIKILERRSGKNDSVVIVSKTESTTETLESDVGLCQDESVAARSSNTGKEKVQLKNQDMFSVPGQVSDENDRAHDMVIKPGLNDSGNELFLRKSDEENEDGSHASFTQKVAEDCPHKLNRDIHMSNAEKYNPEDIDPNHRDNADNSQSIDAGEELGTVNYSNDGKVDGEDDMVDFMSTASFPVVTICHTAPTCQGSSGAPVIHKGFRFDKYWLPLSGGHFGYDLNLQLSFFRYNKATL